MAEWPFLVKGFFVLLLFCSIGNARAVDDLHPTFALISDEELNKEFGKAVVVESLNSDIGSTSDDTIVPNSSYADAEYTGNQGEIIPSSETTSAEFNIEDIFNDIILVSSTSEPTEIEKEDAVIPKIADTELTTDAKERPKKDVPIPGSVQTELEPKTENSSKETVISPSNVTEVTASLNKTVDPKTITIPGSLETLFGSNDDTILIKVDTINTPKQREENATMDGITVFGEKAYEGKICGNVTYAESGEIAMPAPPLEPSCKAWSWTVTVGDGFYADVTVQSLDVNHKVNEFMIIGPGSSMSDLWDDDSNPILSSIITSPRTFRILDADTFSVLLVTNTPSGFKGGFKINFERAGKVSTTPAPTTPSSTLPTPAENVTSEIQVFLGGFTPRQFDLQKVKFQKAVADMANAYCRENNIQMIEDSTGDNVVLSLITQCDVTWPYSETCVQVNMSVAVITPDSADPDSFELTAEHLQDMWDKNARDDPGLAAMGLKAYDIPDAQSSLYLWLAVSLGVLVIFIMILLAVWRIEIFRDYSRMGGKHDSISYSQRSSMTSNDSWFPPSEHQMVPPFMDIYSEAAGYVEYEPEFDGPVPVAKYTEPKPVVPSTADYSAAPSYGPPVGFGGAIHFYGNKMRSDFDNAAFVEEDDGDDMTLDGDDMTLDEEVNTDTVKMPPSGILKKNINNSLC